MSHATFPTVLLVDDVLRIYFSCRNADGKSLMTFLDVDPDDPTRIVRLHDQPLLEVGVPGTFDDSGTQCNWAMWNGSEVWLYYLGWNLGVTVPSRNNTGLAVSDDGGVTFRKAFQGPVLDRTPHEPFFRLHALHT